MILETVIGIEVHAELNTKSKIFCACSTAFGGDANSKVCPICSGQPGTLPKLNEAVVESAVKLGLVLNCTVNKNCMFDRKNYFYPDLPKAYQVSQLYFPICTDGSLEIDIAGKKKNIGIREIHIEEDAGKLIHSSCGDTYVDYNRAGVPLLEIVTNPDFTSAAEVTAFIEKLKETMLYLDISDCKMQEGSLRADINLSIRQPNGKLGIRTETKNLNSLKAISHAIEYERERQAEIIRQGGKIVQQTRRWNEDKNISYPMRSKENAQDYRYFHEPDLQALEISDGWLENIRRTIPELAHERRLRYIRDFGISSNTAEIICSSKNLADIFEDTAKKSAEPTEAANLVAGELMRLINNSNTEADSLKIDSDKLSYLISLLKNGKINRGIYKDIVGEVFANNVDVQKYIAEKKLLTVNDDRATAAAVDEVIAENNDAADGFIAGREKAFAFLMGQTMRKLQGKADPAAVQKVLLEKLKERSLCQENKTP